jgi:hypothetical protein
MVIVLGMDINGLTVARALGLFNIEFTGITSDMGNMACYSKDLSELD